MNRTRSEGPVSSHRGGAGHLARAASWLLVLILVVPSAAAASEGESEATGDTALRAEYGVTLALGGRMDEAERVFISVLSEDPENAATLNNLGNLHLARGDVDVALAFYRTAALADSTDAGIVLNRSIALMLLGDEAGAEAEAARGLEMAGGADAARIILGLPSGGQPDENAKAADQAFLTQEEIAALLDAVSSSVPSDTTASVSGDSLGAVSETAPEKVAQPKTWRSAGPRASGGSELSTMLYWKG
jgi:tetratricopeptide (TPR) repeat protein